ncbi:MAG: glycosyltransferase family 2 protein, partial [Candidatus Methylomirabilales bacterium]
MLNVSAVIPVRNAIRTLPDCLAALERLEPAPAEILLVDNGSTDGSLLLLRAFARDRAAERAQVLEEPRRGAAAARNA